MKTKSDLLQITLQAFNLSLENQVGMIDINKVINFYPYGSFVYQTNTKKSDIDYIAVYDSDQPLNKMIEGKYNDLKMNINLYSLNEFFNKVQNHDIDALECLFLPNDMKYENVDFLFDLDLTKLRIAVSSVSSNSWVKCKKKFIDNEDYIAKKSMFHSLRILDYGIQLAKTNKIDFPNTGSETLKNYDTLEDLLTDIMNFDNWNDLNNKFKPIYNALKSEFKIIAPK